MIPALCAAAAVFLVVPPTSRVPVDRRRISVPVNGWAAIAAGAAAVVLLGFPVGLFAAPVVGWVAHRLVARTHSSADRRARTQIARQLPAVLDLVVAALRAGRPPALAFAVAAEAAPEPVAIEVRRVADLIAVSVGPVEVWRALMAHPDLAPVARAMHRADAAGLPAARMLALTADELRRQHGAELRGRGRSVAVMTAAPLGACFLPAFFLVGVVPIFIGLLESL